MNERYPITDTVSIPSGELSFRFSRSSGKGGQNVNKVSTRVEVSFDVLSSPSLQEFERTLVLSRLRSRIDASGILTVSADSSRSQWQNRQEAVEKICGVLRRALEPDTPRVPTRPSRSSKMKRLKQKQRRSSTKQLRSSPARGNRNEE